MSDAQDELLVDQVLEFRGGPIVVVGDLLLDRWISGTADRLSREAPAPVVRVRGREDAPGGAANTAMNLAALGAAVRLVGLVGDDEPGSALLALLEAAGVDVSGVVRGSGPTTVKTRVSAAGQVLMRFDEGATADAADGDAVAAALRGALPGSAAVLVCDYGMDAAGAAVRTALAEDRGAVPLVLDAHDLAPWAAVRPDVVTPNAGETERLLGRALGDDRVRSATEAGAELRQRTGAAAVIVTLDRDGTVVHADGGPSRTLAKPAPDANANGAGDTFAAALVLALAAGMDVHRAARLGQLAADVVTRLPGTSVCTANDLTASLAGGARLLDERALVAALGVARAAGKRIVFTNGCFDVLHRGHTAYLKQARALGDLLVVAVNDDESTRRLKGPGRPVNPVADRAGVVAELACVDFITVFSTDTPIPLLETIAPDVYAKGGDYLPEMLAETPVVEANGGVVRILDYISPHSTSDLIARVRAAGVAGA
ncbi:PfkB family carbohydrate kinase [Amnibacterium kyonggiense]|uniref:RfaE bifunctional protein kinase chain/domain/rfaE bifunctional protein nucleotidyltransferase chain/domain n=1 Tax=Amnibacterium kyonggiense TaxID=595671 RepID=A0A4R7FIK9_9MICO|nr:PfkB family carbohydrate kinase [Amnibacterium kyonggiense]TDS76051.1 rfaE bifunctional protein kinase chain/domain/rfaE bifunctional protein nucleotidyltransferase chain/domain [Amnibacterium kyonggiense]